MYNVFRFPGTTIADIHAIPEANELVGEEAHSKASSSHSIKQRD